MAEKMEQALRQGQEWENGTDRTQPLREGKRGIFSEHVILPEFVEEFCRELTAEERSRATVEKYRRDVKALLRFLGNSGVVSKEKMVSYKEELLKRYAVSSVNSMLAAANSFLKSRGWYECTVKSVRVQREAFRCREKELSLKEYYRLLEAAGEKKGKRLYYVMQALCSTGIRVSELPFITVEAVKRKRARVHLKGKSRWVLLPTKLCAQLKAYAARRGIREGSIFVTGSGKPLDRSNILHEMKSVCREAKVERGKVFPHNLRHLFACTYYDREKDLTHLADLLGHSSVNTTRIYTRVSGEEQVKQIDGLGLVKEGRKKTA